MYVYMYVCMEMLLQSRALQLLCVHAVCFTLVALPLRRTLRAVVHFAVSLL